MGETALERTVIGPIKVQEPGHFAFYRMSAQEMVQTGVLAPGGVLRGNGRRGPRRSRWSGCPLRNNRSSSAA